MFARVGERGEYLSVGERQLVALARGYLADPGCLILDEATSAVDPATEVALRNAIERLTEGRTALTIAHWPATAERADLILVLERAGWSSRAPIPSYWPIPTEPTPGCTAAGWPACRRTGGRVGSMRPSDLALHLALGAHPDPGRPDGRRGRRPHRPGGQRVPGRAVAGAHRRLGLALPLHLGPA